MLMGAVTVAPSVEAMIAIVDRINTGTAYDLKVKAAYSELQIDEREHLTCLRVDVTTEDEEQLVETLDVEDRTSHSLRIWIRAPLIKNATAEMSALKLIVRQVFQRVNNFNSANARVKVWACDVERKQNPDKAILHQEGLFVASLMLRAEVEVP